MRSTFAGLNTAVRGLNTHQTMLDTMGHNISNVSTDGYSRQSVNPVTMPSQTIGGRSGRNQIGAGVDVQSITRARDMFIDRQYWKENSTRAYGQVMRENLEKIENIFQEPSDEGLKSMFNDFWDSWQLLSTNAADYATRANVKACGDNVVNAVQLAARQIKDNISDLNSVVDLKVDTFNQMSSEVYALNKKIALVEFNGDHANDLRDRRDYLIDQMSNLTKVNVQEAANGSYNVTVNGNMIISGDGYKKLETRTEVDTDYGYPKKMIGIEGFETLLSFNDGEFKALLEARDSAETGNKRFLNELTTLGKYFLTDFNKIHRAGMGTDNSTNNNFFGKIKNTSGEDFDFINGGLIRDPNTGAVKNVNTADWTKGDWLNAFCMNTVYNTDDGLGKISAKTSLNSEIIAKFDAPTVTTSGSYKGANRILATIKKETNLPTQFAGTATVAYDGTAFNATVASAVGGGYEVTVGGGRKVKADFNAADGTLKFEVDGMGYTFGNALNKIVDPTQYTFNVAAGTAGSGPPGNATANGPGGVTFAGTTAVLKSYDGKEFTAGIERDASGGYVVNYGGNKTAPVTFDSTNGTVQFEINGVKYNFGGGANKIVDPTLYKFDFAKGTAGAVPGAMTASLKTGAAKYMVSYTDNGVTKSTEAIYYDGYLSFEIDGLTVKSKVGDKPEEFQYQLGKDPRYPDRVEVFDKAGEAMKPTSQVTIKTEGAYTEGNSKSTNFSLFAEKNGAGYDYFYQVGDGNKVAVTPGADGKLHISDIMGLKMTIDVDELRNAGEYKFVLTKNNNASGDNAVNLANLLKSGEVETFGNQSLETHYAAFISDLSINSQNSSRVEENQEALVLDLENWRQSVCGVNIDEEMSDMIRFQRGYGASSRVITTMDEMLDKLINSTGVVGR